MRPGINSTASIGDQDFNLTVKNYSIPDKGTEKFYISGFRRQVTGLAAGNSVNHLIINGSLNVPKMIIKRIEYNAYLTTSAGVAKTINYIVFDAAISGFSNMGLTSFPGDSNANTFINQSMYHVSYPSSYEGVLNGPFYISNQMGANANFGLTTYASFTLNDIITYFMRIYWTTIV